MTTPENISDAVCAEIPPPDGPLPELVVNMMIHRPCSHVVKSRLSCVQYGAGKRGFPKLFSDTALITENSFPNYRRNSP